MSNRAQKDVEANMLQVRRIADFVSLDQVRSQWNELSDGIPFRRFEWLGTWAETYLKDGQLYVLAATDQQKLVGLLPLFRSSIPGRGQCLQWLGAGEVCTDYLGVFARPSFQESVIDAFSQWLVDAARVPEHCWDSIQLDGVDNDETSVRQLQRRMSEFDCTFHRQPALNCWRIQLPASWEEMLAQMSRSHRKQLRRVERRILEAEGTRLVTASDESTLRQGMDVLVRLHQKRRKSLGEPGCFASSCFSEFLHRAASRLMDSEILRLTWAEMEGQPVAAEFQLAGSQTTFAYQAGVDPQRMDKEPGRLITIAMLQKAIAEGKQGYDFLRGDEPYKAHWRALPRSNCNVRIVAPKAASQLRHGIWLAGSSLKGFVQAKIQGGS
ncbi:MAG: GNAT family N-acetyltransferase [Pirellulales bacterium]|nr:GNAT family N-acetyltransferase [Pirellulales bacterium]